ncbi:MAG: D-2-hydroxyacid dehydrogenase [Ruminococcaceae bacterium]|nr:D-2-hydroxyacid dehydrogenase [Oscillospiraceae bacterium]
MRIVVTDAATVVGGGIDLAFLREFGEVTEYDLTPPELLLERLQGAEAVLCNKTQITAQVMAACPTLKYVGLFATGYNNVDVAYAAAHGVTVCNVPGYSTEAVAQHTVSLLLAVTNRVHEYNETVAQGDWLRSSTFAYFPLPLMELNGKTIGIVGYGAIGRRVGAMARAFGMTVLVCGRRPIPDTDVQQVPFEELLSRSDVVTLHCPLNADSEGMMNAAAFAKMKPGAIFINTSRGGLVVEQALRDALDSGHLLGAGVDVLQVEPMTEDCPLYGAPRLLITPHIAWAGWETRRRLMGVVAENLRRFIAGDPINRV